MRQSLFIVVRVDVEIGDNLCGLLDGSSDMFVVVC